MSGSPLHDHGVTLAICRDEVALSSVLSQEVLNRAELVIASDDLCVHELVKKYARLQVVYLDQGESFLDVAPDVLAVLNAVNAWLSELGDEKHLPAEFLYWIQHVEGGYTTQRILDGILEARSCLAIFDQINPSNLIIGAGLQSYWEDEVLVACAERKNIPVRRLRSLSLERIARDLRQRLRPFAERVHQTIMTLGAIFRRGDSGVGNEDLGQYVALQMCTRMTAHYDNTLPLVEALEHEGLKTVITTFAVGRLAEQIRSRGYKVVELDAWVPLRVLVRSWWAALAGLWRVREKRATFLAPESGGKYAPLIRSILLASARRFLIAEIPQLICLDAACKAFFLQNPPIAARLFTDILHQGVITYRAMASIGVRPLLFRQIGLDLLPNPYYHHDAPVDLFFCASDAGRERLQAEGKTVSRIIVCGVPWRNRVEEFAMKNTVEQSRSSLGISSQVSFVVFCDAQVVLRGYFSLMEQIALVQAMVAFAERHEDVAVILKPHPTYQRGKLESMFEQRGYGRVIWMPGNASPYDGLNSADVVITKMSTLAAEAMVLGVPSICVLLDKDKRWAIYEDAVDYAFSVDELSEKLDALMDGLHYSSWANGLRVRQQNCLERHFPKPSENTLSFVARKVSDALVMSNRLQTTA